MVDAANEASIDALVPLAVDGDRKALQTIINYIHPRMVQYCRRRMVESSFPSPEDVAQEICFAVATSISRYVDSGRSFMSYVYGIAGHKLKDSYRASSKDQSHVTDEVPEVVHEVDGPEELAIITDSSNKVGRVLDVLNERAREIIILRVFQGLSAEETAEVVGSTPGAVRVAQHRAIAKLKEAIERESGDYW